MEAAMVIRGAIARRLAVLGWLLCGLLVVGSIGVHAQASLSFAGQLRSAHPQSLLPTPVASMPKACSSISSLSRRCYFTFDKECKARGESRDHCIRMSGFCHGCTDAYASCKGDQARIREKTHAAATDCSTCNAAYGRCISRMVEQYGGKLLKSK
jgi:hypothetical protein